MATTWTRPNEQNVSRTPAAEGGEYADQSANPGHADGVAFVRQMIGDGAQVATTGRSIEYWSGDAMSDTGLAYNISGRATVIEAGVGERLAGFQDPIKAIFGTSICHDKTVIVKRKYVVGGAATITPERAPARTVQVREDVQSIELQRYGGDVTMNTNLFLRPADAEAEMKMKLDAQKKQLENKLVELGYNEIFDKALRLPDVAVRANPAFSMYGSADVDSPAARAYARTVYFRSCFGAFSKHEFPLANLLASCKTSGAYTSADGPATVLVLPHGSSEMLRYTKASSMNYSISGLRTADQKPVNMTIDNVAEDPSSGVKIMVHVPPSSYARSAALPSVSKGLLSEEVTLYMTYDPGDFSDGRIPDLQNGSWMKIPNAAQKIFTGTRDQSTGTIDGPGGKKYRDFEFIDSFETALTALESNQPMSAQMRTWGSQFYQNTYASADRSWTDPATAKDALKAALTQGGITVNLGSPSGLSQSKTAGLFGDDEEADALLILIKKGLATYDFDNCFHFNDLLEYGRAAVSLLSLEQLVGLIKRSYRRIIHVDEGDHDIVAAIDGSHAEGKICTLLNALYRGHDSTYKETKLTHEKTVGVATNEWLNLLQLFMTADRTVRSNPRCSKGNLTAAFLGQLQVVKNQMEALVVSSNGAQPADVATGIDSETDSPVDALLKVFTKLGELASNAAASDTSRCVDMKLIIDQLCSAPNDYAINARDWASYLKRGSDAVVGAFDSLGAGTLADGVAARASDAYRKITEKLTTQPEEEQQSAGVLGAIQAIFESTGVTLLANSVMLSVFATATAAKADMKRWGQNAEANALEVVSGSYVETCMGYCSGLSSCLDKTLGSDWKTKLVCGISVVGIGAAVLANSGYLGNLTGSFSSFADSAADTLLEKVSEGANRAKQVAGHFFGLVSNDESNGLGSSEDGADDGPDTDVVEEVAEVEKGEQKLPTRKENAKLAKKRRKAANKTGRRWKQGNLRVSLAKSMRNAVVQGVSESTLGSTIEWKDALESVFGKPISISNSNVPTPLDYQKARTILVREFKVTMSSAIIAKCGSDTGELLVGYPMTGVSTNQRTESMTIALRVYLGAILKKPENVTIIPHVAFEGIAQHGSWFAATVLDQPGNSVVESGGVKFIEVAKGDGTPVRSGYAYAGTVAKKNGNHYEITTPNAGPLGHLDDPHYMECVNGLQVYKEKN